MAVEAPQSASQYILHHLTNNARGSGFWTIHVDSVSVSILLGQGDGSFTGSSSFGVGLGPVWVVVGDYNADGKQDLATADSAADKVTILLGQVTDEGGANLDAMEEIATTSGGESFSAETANQLTSRFENLGSELNVNLDVEPSTKPLVIAAIALAVLAGLMLIILPR